LSLTTREAGLCDRSAAAPFQGGLVDVGFIVCARRAAPQTESAGTRHSRPQLDRPSAAGFTSGTVYHHVGDVFDGGDRGVALLEQRGVAAGVEDHETTLAERGAESQ
jgi:hypothetical protein